MERIRAAPPPDSETCIVGLTLRKDLWIYLTQSLAESGLEHLNFSFVLQLSDNVPPWELMFHILEEQAGLHERFLCLLLYGCQTLLSSISNMEEASEHQLLLWSSIKLSKGRDYVY